MGLALLIIRCVHYFMRENSIVSPRQCEPSQYPIFPTEPSAAKYDRLRRLMKESIRKAGGIDRQLLGIGRNGHIVSIEADLQNRFSHRA